MLLMLMPLEANFIQTDCEQTHGKNFKLCWTELARSINRRHKQNRDYFFCRNLTNRGFVVSPSRAHARHATMRIFLQFETRAANFNSLSRFEIPAENRSGVIFSRMHTLIDLPTYTQLDFFAARCAGCAMPTFTSI